MRRLSGSGSGFGSNSGSFFKRFSLGGSNKGSFAQDIAQSVVANDSPLEGSELGVDDSTNSFDAQRMLNNMILSTQSDRDDQSETSSASAMKRSGRSLKSVFKRTPKKTKIATTLSIVEEFTRIKNDWMHNSTQAGAPLSNSILTEFNKRTTAALTSDRKSKLNFSRCELNDIQLKLLIQELAQKPVLSKLDLSGNSISSTGAEYIKQLLISQLELSVLMEPTVRENAVFLSEVILLKSKLAVSNELLDEIESLTAVLAHHNAKNSMYSAYSALSCPERVEQTGLVSMWTQVFDRAPDTKTLKAMLKDNRSSSGAQRKDLTYAEIEAFMMTVFVKQGIIPKLTAKQEAIIAGFLAKLPVRRLTMPASADSIAGSARDSKVFGDFGECPERSAQDSEAFGDFDHDAEDGDNRSCTSQDSSVHAYGDAEDCTEGLPSPPKLLEPAVGKSRATNRQVINAASATESIEPLAVSSQRAVKQSQSSPEEDKQTQDVQTVKLKLPLKENTVAPPLSPSREKRIGQSDMIATIAVEKKGLGPATPAVIEEKGLSIPLKKSSVVTKTEMPIPSPITLTVNSQQGSAAIAKARSPFTAKEVPNPSTSSVPTPLVPSNLSDKIKSESSPSSQRLESLSSLSTPASRLSYSPVSTTTSSPRSIQLGDTKSPNSLITQPTSVKSNLQGSMVSIPSTTAASTATASGLSLQSSPISSSDKFLPVTTTPIPPPTPPAALSAKSSLRSTESTTAPGLSQPSKERIDKTFPAPASSLSQPSKERIDKTSPAPASSLSQPSKERIDKTSTTPASSLSQPSKERIDKTSTTAAPGLSQPSKERIDKASPTLSPKASAVAITTGTSAPLSTLPKSKTEPLQAKKAEVQESTNMKNISKTSHSLQTPPQLQAISVTKTEEVLPTTSTLQSTTSLTALPTELTLSEDSIEAENWEEVEDSAFAIDLSDHVLDSSDYKSILNIPSDSQCDLPVAECKASTGSCMQDQEIFSGKRSNQMGANRQEEVIQQEEQRTLSENVEKQFAQQQAAYYLPSSTLATTAPAFLIHGIPRKKFNLVELDNLASLPRILLATDLTDGTQFTIGCPSNASTSPNKRHSHALTENQQSSYMRNLQTSSSAPMQTIVLSNIDLDDTKLAAELLHRDRLEIETASMLSCRITSLPLLRLSERLSRLIELDLRHCALTGRLPANTLPHGLLRLDLSCNSLTDFSGVATCTALQELNLSNNQIETVHVVPRTLIRLGLENNLIWNKLCLRIIALSSKLQSICLDGNPVTVLVPGWAAQLRSMGSRLHYMDGRAVVLGDSGQPLQARASSFTAKYKHHHSQKVQLTLTEQQQHDEERAKSFQYRHIENEYKRELYLDSLLGTAMKVVKPEEELIETAKRLSEPKFISPKQLSTKKKSSISSMQKSTFGIGRVDFDRYLGLNVDAVKHGPSYLTPTPPAPPFKPKISSIKWNKNTALETLNKWIYQAGEGLDYAAKLINRIDHELAQINRSVTMDDLQAYQRELVQVKLDSCDPLQFAVKLALDTMRTEVSLVRTITQLHDKVIGYNAVLHQIESAMTLCAAAGKTFATSFHIIMHSEAGMTLSEVPKEEIIPAQEGVQRVHDQLHSTLQSDTYSGSSSRNKHHLTIGSISTNSSSISPTGHQPLPTTTAPMTERKVPIPGNPHSPAHSKEDATAATAVHAWRTQAQHDLHNCTVILQSLTANISSTEPITSTTTSIIDHTTTERKLFQYFEKFQNDIKQLNLSQYNYMTPTLAKQAEMDRTIIELLKELKSFHGLFTQIENMLLLCMKGGISFLPAFEVLMNSAVGRVVKKVLREGIHVRMEPPYKSMQCKSMEDSLGTVSSSSSPGGGIPVDTLTTAASQTAAIVTAERVPVEVGAIPPFSEQALETTDELAGLALISTLSSTENHTTSAPALGTATQSNLSQQIDEDRNSTTILAAAPGSANTTAGDAVTVATGTVNTSNTTVGATESESDLNESIDQLDFTVIDPNTTIVEAWMERCECVLGRAAVTLNSVIQHAHRDLPISTEDLENFHQDRCSIDIISCEPPSKEVSAALHTLTRENAHDLLQKSAQLRYKLDTYDDFFLQIENAMKLCQEDRYDFQYALNLLMNTELGKRIKSNMHNIYDDHHSTMYNV